MNINILNLKTTLHSNRNQTHKTKVNYEIIFKTHNQPHNSKLHTTFPTLHANCNQIHNKKIKIFKNIQKN